MCYYNETKKLIEEKYEIVRAEKLHYYEKLKRLSKEGKNSICIFGASEIGISIADNLKRNGIEINMFVDNDFQKWGEKIYDEKYCYSPKKLKTIDQPIILLGLTQTDKVAKQLEQMGVHNNVVKNPVDYFHTDTNNWINCTKEEILRGIEAVFNILGDVYSQKIIYYKVKGMLSTLQENKNIDYGEIFSQDEYLPKDLFQLNGIETIVDGGAFDGDTIKYLIAMGIKFEKYLAFELDESNYLKLVKYVSGLDQNLREKIQTYNIGLGKMARTIKYSSSSMSTRINATGNSCAKIEALDNLCYGKKPTYIKLDVEGAEIEVIQGAQEIITEHKPKLAVCVYHKATDLWEIPVLLKKIEPTYKLYLRHHTKIQHDTVCYAL